MKASKIKGIISLALILSSAPLLAQKKYTNIYPFVPMDISEIYDQVEKVSEDENFIKNFKYIINNNLSEGKTATQPWSTSYWPLSKGVIADPYENSKVRYYVDFLKSHTGVWRSSWSKFQARKNGTHKRIDSLNNAQLSMLAPSEKYDLILGDYDFDLTNRLMQYMHRYGNDNKYGSLSKIQLSAQDTSELVDKYVSWGWYDSWEEALRVDIVLSRRLEAQRALELIDSGKEVSVYQALKKVTPQALEDAKNYVIADRVLTDIAAWEGICNGWSTAAGIIPRPRNAVDINIGKRSDGSDITIRFYPDDIKGLISLYWFNSLLQGPQKYDEKGKRTGLGGTTLVGQRCNQKNIKRDRFGRFYDTEKDPYSGKLEPRCVGVHPAKWHLGLVNLIGKQKRSFIVERKVKSPVDNHPMYKYSMRYFNPNTGRKKRNIDSAIVAIDRNDQFLDYRHPKAKYIVGVETKMYYMDYLKPIRRLKNSEAGDEIVTKRMMYDLELDADYNIIGGQWRATYVGEVDRFASSSVRKRPNNNQPDFFWAMTKDWKKTGLMNSVTDVEPWVNTKQAPPASWLERAKKAHDFHLIESTDFGTGNSCNVKNTITGETRQAWCEIKTNRPQPFSNVVNKLMELSSGVSFDSL